ncbi:MAG TPA: four helix bundle protein [Pyrinomonadaceae bacterium]|nr:four helix bundle protein [Pyrinomonadaceae bacterium]
MSPTARRPETNLRYKRFEDLPVWQTAIQLAVGVYQLTAKPVFNNHYSLKDQIERAAVSVSNNIAEGFERGTNKELLAFLYISRGSAGETRSILCLLQRLSWFNSVDRETAFLKTKAESCSKQLKAWIASLQDSDFRGERFVNQNSKRNIRRNMEREEFLKELEEIKGRKDLMK